MATKIVTKNSSTASAVPTASDLVQGELAVNVADKRLFTEDNAGSIIELGTKPSTIDINAGTIDGTAIGASSASTGAFTTLTATGAFTSVGIDDNATSTAITIDSSENVGIGTSSPDTQLTLYKASTNADVNYAKMRMDSWGGSTGKLKSIVWDDAGNSVAGIGAEYDGGKTNIHFHSQYSGGFKGTADRTMSIMGNGNVGIGTSSPASKLDINGDGTTLRLDGTANTSRTLLLRNVGGSAEGVIQTDGNMHLLQEDASKYMRFSTANTERMRIDSSGNVGIGQTTIIDSASGRKALTIGGSLSSIITFGNAGTRWGGIYASSADYSIFSDSLMRFEASGSERMRIDSSGNVGIGTSSPTAKLTVSGIGVGAAIDWTNTTASIGRSYRWVSLNNGTGFAMEDLTAGSERMRIDSSGNLLVGTTDSNVYNDATGTGTVIQSNGIMQLAANNGTPLYANRQGNDGDIIDFRKDGSPVGSIGTFSGDLTIGDDDIGIRFDTGTGLVPWDLGATATGGSARDAAIDIGASSARFKDLYLSGGVYLGGTGSANKLDDYEEGTWTPVLTGNGYSFGTHTGRYVKVGSLVYITALLNVTTVGNNNSIIGWTGAPFTSESITNLHQIGVVRESSTTGRLYQIQINSGSSGGSLNSMDGIAGGSNEIFTTGTYAVSVTYKI